MGHGINQAESRNGPAGLVWWMVSAMISAGVPLEFDERPGGG
jgi:hypothetical protein